MIKHLSRLILILLLLIPMTAFAQDDDEVKTETYESEAAQFSLDYPADWFIVGQEAFPGVYISNSKDYINDLSDENPPEEGEVRLLITLFPNVFLTMLNIEASPVTPIRTLTEQIGTVFFDVPEGDPLTVDPPVMLPIDDTSGQFVGVLFAEEPEQASFIMVHQLTPEVVVIAAVIGARGDLEQFIDPTLQIVTSVNFEGIGNDLFDILMGEAEDPIIPDPTAEPTEEPEATEEAE